MVVVVVDNVVFIFTLKFVTFIIRDILGNNAAITGIQSVAVLATTAAQWVLWNADPIRTCFFETIGMYNTSGTPGVGGVLFCSIITAPAQVGAGTTGTSIVAAGGGNTSSKIIVKTGVTVTGPTAPNWLPIAENNSSNVGAFPGSGNFANRGVAGRIAIQPGQGLGLYVLTPAGTTPLFAPFAEWVELETDME